ncbi:MAG: hypothetical protein JWM95_41 [Gemmatimonadetes bacterium]|nr:hypothetical protein [Gemmatimonadota bacterium]
MSRRLHATPLDAKTIAIREFDTAEIDLKFDAALTPLLVLPSENDDLRRRRSVQVVVTVPGTGGALDRSEADAVRNYFEWESGDSFWWKTQYPAYFDVERLTTDILVGKLTRRGGILPVAGAPGRRPDASQGTHFFGTYATREPDAAFVRDLPELLPPVDGEYLFESARTREQRARFPTLGPEIVRLRTMKDVVLRERGALVEEGQRLAALGSQRPGSVPEVLHQGTLESGALRGPFIASRPAIGLEPTDLFAGLSGATVMQRATVIGGALLDVARTMAVAHSLGFTTGALSPGLLRLRPASLQTPDRGLPLYAMLAAIPGAPSAKTFAMLTARYPMEDKEYLRMHPGDVLVKSSEQDLRSLGALGLYLLAIGGVGSELWLDEMMKRLVKDEFSHVQEVTDCLVGLLGYRAGRGPAQ